MTEKRRGPRLTVLAECDGCECELTENDDMDCFCVHPAVGKKAKGVDVAEAWCPIMPTGKIIGTCADCINCDPEEGDEWICSKGYAKDHLVPLTFGCIHWEERG